MLPLLSPEGLQHIIISVLLESSFPSSAALCLWAGKEPGLFLRVKRACGGTFFEDRFSFFALVDRKRKVSKSEEERQGVY